MYFRILLAMVIAASTFCVQAADDTLLIFLLAGQSNMAGHGLKKDLQEELKKPLENVVIFNKVGAIIPFKPGDQHGPEVGFAHALVKAFPNRKIGIIKVAVGASSLYYDWDPDWTPEKGKAATTENAGTGQGMYKTLIEQARICLEKSNGTLSGMLWMQGESDAKHQKTADKYGENLKAFIERVRKDLNTPKLPFVAAQIGAEKGIYKYLETVQKAQAELKVPNYQTVPTQDLDRPKDGVHLDTKSLSTLGQRYAEAMEKLLTGKE